MTQRFDRLPAEAGLFMQVWAENVLGALETALTDLEAVNDEQTSLLTQIQAAQADIVANQTELAAQLLLIQQAQADADTANASVAVQLAYEKTRDSEPTGLTIAATDAGSDATASISAHDRVYLDDGSVAVDAGSITALDYETEYFIFYNDPDFEGGAVTYEVTTDNAAAVASLSNPTRHFVGVVTTPASGGGEVPGTSPIPPWKL